MWTKTKQSSQDIFPGQREMVSATLVTPSFNSFHVWFFRYLSLSIIDHSTVQPFPPGPQKEITLAIADPRCSSRNPGAWNPVVWYSPAHGFWWSLPVGDFTGYQKSYFEHLKMLTTLRTGTSISSGIRYATLAMPMVNGSAQAQNCTHPHQQQQQILIMMYILILVLLLLLIILS